MQLVPTFLKTVLLFFNPLVATSWNICGRGSSWSLLSRWHDILKPQFLFFQVSYSKSVKTWVISREIQITTQNSHSHLVGLTQWVCGCVFYLMKNIIKSYVKMYSSSATKVNMQNSEVSVLGGKKKKNHLCKHTYGTRMELFSDITVSRPTRFLWAPLRFFWQPVWCNLAYFRPSISGRRCGVEGQR